MKILLSLKDVAIKSTATIYSLLDAMGCGRMSDMKVIAQVAYSCCLNMSIDYDDFVDMICRVVVSTEWIYFLKPVKVEVVAIVAADEEDSYGEGLGVEDGVVAESTVVSVIEGESLADDNSASDEAKQIEPLTKKRPLVAEPVTAEMMTDRLEYWMENFDFTSISISV